MVLDAFLVMLIPKARLKISMQHIDNNDLTIGGKNLFSYESLLSSCQPPM